MKIDQGRLTALHELENILGLFFSHIQYLHQALLHSSYAHQHHIQSNERLEFLGDSVLELVVSSHLYLLDHYENEGDLTKVRASLVNEKNLATLAKSFRLQDYLLTAHGVSIRKQDAALADACEAIIGAVYLDQGYDQTKKWLWPFLKKQLEQRAKDSIDQDYKSQLQVYAQKNLKQLPEYKIMTIEGPEHNQIMTCRVYLNGVVSGEGKGRNKKQAEQEAAQLAYLALLGGSKHG
ncbi:MAG: ribonuclease III [Spirochaetia bacterium]